MPTAQNDRQKQDRQKPRGHNSLLNWLVHLARIGVVVGLLLAIPSPVRNAVESGDAAPLQNVQSLLPSASAIDELADASGLWTVRDPSGEPIAKVGRTLPMADDVVGYRGPTESLIVFDDDLIIKQVDLLSSSDTQEHVDAIVNSPDFYDQFCGWSWGGPEDEAEIDAVSGATLTSLALAEGILKRIGGERPSLVFADSITIEEQQKWLSKNDTPERLIRTGPLSDDITGYQGPSELLIKLDEDERVERIALRRSFDNEPYVDYVRTEYGFWKLFRSKTLNELAEIDLEAAGVEGVSGATMTSLAVAQTIVAAAKKAGQKADAPVESSAKPFYAGVRWTTADWSTIAALALLGVLSRMGWFRQRVVRRLWLVGVFVVIGLWAGNLVSMALIAGWSAEGIAWRLAPGLAAIAAVALVAPPLTKGNPYCNHLCPHGAIQQLVRPSAKSKRRIKLPAKLQRVLLWVPGVMLVIAYVMLITTATIDLSSWEPFHAYLFRIASWSAIGLAAITLLLAAFVPMGYCRLGCPTGRLLDHLRRTASSHKISMADIVSVLLLIGAVVMTRWA